MERAGDRVIIKAIAIRLASALSSMRLWRRCGQPCTPGHHRRRVKSEPRALPPLARWNQAEAAKERRQARV
jgi:hypothetical protein